MNKLSLSIAALGLAAAFGAHAEFRTDLLGDPVETSAATRTIAITPNTQYVNVSEGEVIKFVSGDHEFAFKFDGPNAEAFDLQRVAPQGALDHKVTAYVAPNHGDGGGLGGHGQ